MAATFGLAEGVSARMTRITGMKAFLISLGARVPAEGLKNREAEEDQGPVLE